MLYKHGRTSTFTLKAEQNSYYYTIRWAKGAYWAAFLQRLDEILVDSRYCWTALWYTKPWALSTTPSPMDNDDNTATSHGK